MNLPIRRVFKRVKFALGKKHANSIDFHVYVGERFCEHFDEIVGKSKLEKLDWIVELKFFLNRYDYTIIFM